jgi:integrase
MASITKRAGSWRALIRLKGHPPQSETFPTKREAQEWAAAEESALRAGRRGTYPAKTVADALRRYELEVTVDKRSRDGERKRLAAFGKDFPAIAAKVLHKVTAADLSAWRDARLRTVQPSSVLRDIALLRHVWTVASRDWGWCSVDTPWRQLRLPADTPPRDAMWTWRPARLLLRRLGYVTGRPPSTPREEIGYLFLLGLHTGMRQGEIHSLTTHTLNLGTRVARLGVHKTMEQVGARHVPIPRRAAKVLQVLVDNAQPDGRLFTVARASVDTLFRKYRDQCLIKGLTFHDTRASALTWLSRRVDVLTLARISGHSDLAMLGRRYYRERAEDIAARI